MNKTLPGLYIMQSPDNPVYSWNIRYQMETDLIPLEVNYPSKDRAMTAANNIAQNEALVFIAVTRRLA